VKQTRQLPIFIVKGLNEPLVGIAHIQKWLSVQITRSNSNNDSESKSGNLSQELPLIFRDEGLDGYQPSEMKYTSSSYSYFSEKMNSDMNHNFQRLVGIKGSVHENSSDSGYKDTKSGKQSEIDKRYQDMMTERKKLLESQNGGTSIKI
jgi:hypothetical protein